MVFHSGTHGHQEGKESAEAGSHRLAHVEDRMKSHRGKTPRVLKHQDTGIYSACVS